MLGVSEAKAVGLISIGELEYMVYDSRNLHTGWILR